MIWQIAIGILSTLALFTPVVVMLVTKLVRYKFYLALFIYCLFACIYNMMTEKYIIVPRDFQRTFGVITNLLDAPLMLSFLMNFANSKKQRKIMVIILGIFVCFETIVVYFKGVTIPAIIIIMGPGISLIFGWALYFFVQNIKRSFLHAKAAGKALMSTAVCFAYGCFTFLYIIYYLFKLPDTPYVFLVYFTITIIYSSLLAIGLVKESKRKRKLEELLETRRELIRFFADEKKPATPKDVTGLWKLN